MNAPWLLLAWFGAALGQDEAEAPSSEEPTAEEPAAPAEEPAAPAEEAPLVVDQAPPTEVVVTDVRLEAAREAIVRAAAEAGYVRRIERKDRTILRHDDPWKGDVVLYRDGRVEVKRQPVRFEPPGGASNPANYLWCVLLPVCIRPAGQTAAPRLYRSNERKALAAIHDEVVDYQERLGTRALDAKLETLPDRLQRFWEDGTPFEDGHGPASTWEERRAVIFAYWDSRTETDWGERVRDAVEAFVLGEVQAGEHPFTPDEIAAFNARRTVRRVFLAPRGAAE